MTRCPGCGSRGHSEGRLRRLLLAVDGGRVDVASLNSIVVAALDAWSGGAHPIVAAEARRRCGNRRPRIADQFTRPTRPGT
jgi:hypothetical protein